MPSVCTCVDQQATYTDTSTRIGSMEIAKQYSLCTCIRTSESVLADARCAGCCLCGYALVRGSSNTLNLLEPRHCEMTRYIDIFHMSLG